MGGGVIRAVCRVPPLSERNFNISAMLLNSAFILALARRAWALALPFLRISAVPCQSRLCFGGVCCIRSCVPTQPSRQPWLEEKTLVARSFSSRQGSAALTTPEESGPACTAPDPNTRRLFAGRGQLGRLLYWSYGPFARTHFALASGCSQSPLPWLFSSACAFPVWSRCWFFTAGRPRLSPESWGHASVSLQSLLHGTSVFSVV